MNFCGCFSTMIHVNGWKERMQTMKELMKVALTHCYCKNDATSQWATKFHCMPASGLPLNNVATLLLIAVAAKERSEYDAYVPIFHSFIISHNRHRHCRSRSSLWAHAQIVWLVCFMRPRATDLRLKINILEHIIITITTTSNGATTVK